MAQPPLVLGASSLIGRFVPAHLPDAIGVGRGEPGSGYVCWQRADLRQKPLFLPAVTAISLAPLWLLPPSLPALLGGGLQRLVAVSSTSRWTKAASPDPREREVARRLADAEAEVARLCDAAGVAWTVLRPTLVYAEGRDRNVSRLAGLARRWRVLPLAGAGVGRRQPVHADDLAAALPAVLAAPTTHGRAYDLPGGETLAYAEMCRRVFAGLGRRPRLLHVPPALWRAGLALASPLLPGATAAMGDRMAEDLVFDPAPAARDFAWAPRPFRPDFRLAPPRAAGQSA